MKDYLIGVVSPITGETLSLDLSISNNFERFASEDPDNIRRTQVFCIINVNELEVFKIRLAMEILDLGVIKKKEEK